MLPEGTHPAIRAKLDDLRAKMATLVSEMEENIADLKGSLALPADFYGITARSSSIALQALTLMSLSGQVIALSAIPYDMKASKEPSVDDLLSILDWILEEQMAGRRPNSNDVAEHFKISAEEAEKIRQRLENSVSGRF